MKVKIHDENDNNPPPPSAEAVARRALILAAISCRACLEDDPAPREELTKFVEQIKGWLVHLSLTESLNDWEWRLLDTPLGELSRLDTINGSWLSEGLTVLAWALGKRELPAYGEQCDPAESANRLGFLQEAATTVLASPTLRTPEELSDYNGFIFNVHWRLRDFQFGNARYDFEHLARRAWGEPILRYGLELAEKDLALQGVPLDQAPEAARRQLMSIVKERHRASNWLIAYDSEDFYEVSTDT